MDISAHQSQLEQEVHRVVDSLSDIFNEIGLDRYERESRQEGIFRALQDALHEQLKEVTEEKNSLREECQKWADEIQQMQRSLGDREDKLTITPPLLSCLECFKKKHEQVSRSYADRYESVKKLVHALNTYASHMEPSIVRIRIPPITDDIHEVIDYDISRQYYDKLEEEFDNVYKEYTKRSQTVMQLAREMTSLWIELGTPKSQVDRDIVDHANQTAITLKLGKSDVEELRQKKLRLVDEKNERIRQIESMKDEISHLWTKFGMDESERRKFLARNSGVDLATMQRLEDELERMYQIKRENIHVFVEDAREQIMQLWDTLYMSKEERGYFQPFFSENFGDDLLETHEMEIQRLSALIEQRAPLLNLIAKHRELMNDKEQLEIAASDTSRLTGRGPRDPSRLLREEKMRKRLAKELPRVEVDLKKALEDWDEEHGAPFLVDGEDYLEILIRTGTPSGPSRAKTPGPGLRGRSNTVGAPSTNPRSKSKPAEKQPLRSKTPTISRSKTPGPQRPKTPGGGLQHSASLSSTIGRNQGRGLTSAQSTYSTSSYTSSYSTASSGASSTVDRASSCRTPGPFGGRVPQLNPTGSIKTPARLTRPGLSTFDSAPQTSPQRRDPPPSATVNGTMTLGRSNAHMVRRRPALSNPPKMQNIFQPPDATPRPTRNSDTSVATSHIPSRPQSVATVVSRNSIRSIRSVSPAESANYEVYPGTDDEDDGPNHHTPKRTSYTQQPDTRERNFSVSTVDSEQPASGSENWETYGDESDLESEADPRTPYYRAKNSATPRSGFTGYGHSRSVGIVREREASNGEERMSEVNY